MDATIDTTPLTAREEGHRLGWANVGVVALALGAAVTAPEVRRPA
jgi:hypothetical protein